MNYDRTKYHHIKFQSKPGTGKYFFIHTMTNIHKSLLKTSQCDEATAPTGCPASLINGKTHYRSLKIPVTSGKLHGVTTNIITYNVANSKLCHERWRNTFIFIMNKDRMAGRPFWAWFKHRLEEARSYHTISIENNEVQVLALETIPGSRWYL